MMDLRAMESRLAEAYREVEGEVAARMFAVTIGPPEAPPTRWALARARMSARWYAARAWIAEHILRVRLEVDE